MSKMSRFARRLSVTTLITVVVLVVTAPPAGATATATSPATSVTATSAVLNGAVVDPGPYTIAQFQYGRTKRYGKATKAFPVSAQSGLVFVSQKVLNLRPGTTYHFRLISKSGNGTATYPIKHNSPGADLTFTTKKSPGKLILLRGKLIVRRGHVSIPLLCSSKRPCNGSLSIRTASNGQNAVCATKRFSITAGRKTTLKPKVTRGCLAMLNAASGHRLGATFRASLRTGQPNVNRTVTLVKQ